MADFSRAQFNVTKRKTARRVKFELNFHSWGLLVFNGHFDVNHFGGANELLNAAEVFATDLMTTNTVSGMVNHESFGAGKRTGSKLQSKRTLAAQLGELHLH